MGKIVGVCNSKGCPKKAAFVVICARGLCKRCYNSCFIGPCINCGLREFLSKGKCRGCRGVYGGNHCSNCTNHTCRLIRGLCQRCYKRKQQGRPPLMVCLGCGLTKLKDGLCDSCGKGG